MDRLAFSSSFRRLGRKTQVHPMAANDHVHTRLTHSLEVSRVGNALGKALGQRLAAENKLKPDIGPSDLGAVVQAACLAHDLGNPPFGHAGEDAIIHWFDQNRAMLPNYLDEDRRHDLTSFEGNAQGFRVITQLENHIFAGGLRLTYATLGAFQKYPWSSREREKKFGAFISEVEILDRVFTELEIPKIGGRWARHPLAFLVEAADDICYGIIDIEDAVELRIIPFDRALEVLLGPFNDEEKAAIKATLGEPSMHRVNFARIRGRVFDREISGAIDAFIANHDKIMLGQLSGSLFDKLPEGDGRRKLSRKLKSLDAAAST